MVQVKNKRAHKAEERRARILEAATEIIGARGYHAFVLQDLAKRCGLTNGGLLYHFTSKEQLLIAVLKEHDRRRTQELVETFGPGLRKATLSTALGMLHGIIQTVVAQPALSRLYAVLQAEALDPSHPAHDHFVAREAAAMEGFATLVARHVSDPMATARQLHALMDGLTLQWLRADQGFDLVGAWDKAIAALRWSANADHTMEDGA
jgi:AcrR family transcriptional regulator